jgi:DNA-binding transcriptional MocR family regulator
MTIDLSIDRQSKTAVYQQIAEQIKTQISNGSLPPNTRLPTVRKLATLVGVTRLTAQNAYAELQADGWLEATVGRGTFVSSAVQPMRMTPQVGQFLTPDHAVDDMISLSKVLGVRSMAMAQPDAALFPIDEFWHHLDRLKPAAGELFGYGAIQGDADLRVEVAKMMGEVGITAVPGDILITGGAMQSVNLLSQALAKPGDTVLVEQPTFLGTLHILETQGLDWVGIPFDGAGPNLAALEQSLKTHKPAFYYTVPNFHNPTGISMDLPRRNGVLALMEAYDCVVVEDDIYGALAFDGPQPLPLKALDTENRVIYLSSFSKSFMPGLRTGYLLMPEPLQTRLLSLRRANDLCGPALTHRALAHFIRDGGLKRHLKRVLPVYRERRDALMSALASEMPAGVTWTRPEGGFCTWVTMPRLFGSGELYRLALESGFAFTPGEAYLLDDPDKEFMRLCFGSQTPAGIRAGVAFLGDLIRRQLEEEKRQAAWLPII